MRRHPNERQRPTMGGRSGLTCALGGLAAVTLAAGPGASEVVLNEILGDPARDWNGDAAVHARDDEWVEIVNLGVDPVDLTGVRIASADTTWRYEFSGVLGPREAAVAYGSDAYQWEVDTGNPAFGLRLTNTGGTIRLWRLTATDTLQIDEAAYGDDDADDDRSTGRRDDMSDEWILFDGLNPYEGDPPPFPTGCLPSPGSTNECLTPVLERSWGSIKSMYTGAGEG